MADNNANVSIDQDFYGAVRFFGSVTIKGVGSFISNADVTFAGITATGNIISNGNIQGQVITAGNTLVGLLRSTIIEGETSDPPTELELVALIGASGNGLFRIVKNTASSTFYLVVGDGSTYYYVALTAS